MRISSFIPLAAVPSTYPRPPAVTCDDTALADLRLVALDHAGLGIALLQDRRIVRCNQRFSELYGFAGIEAAEGVPTQSLFADDADFHRLAATAYPSMAHGGPYSTELRQRRCDASEFWARMTGTMVDPHDASRGTVWIIEDIDARKRTEAALAAAREEHALIFDNANVGMVYLRERRVTRCNRAFEQLFGWAPGELEGRSSRDWYGSDEEWETAGQRSYEPFSQGRAFEGEMVLRHRDGHDIECDVRAKAIDATCPELGSIWITTDITARKRAERALHDARNGLERLVRERTDELAATVRALEQKVREQQEAEARIQRMAHYDALTGLPNRAMLEDRCGVALHAAQRHGHPLALVFLDLDHFKTVNDSLGHRAGDAVLVELARRLQGSVRTHDTVARLGGDEFVLLLPETDAQGASEVARRVLAAAQVPFQVDGHELTVTPSLGIAMHPRDGADLDALSRAADAAMYRAKEDGRNTWHFFTAELQAQSERVLTLSNALRRALERQQLSLVYQPQQELAGGRIIGAEALLRWNHPELGAVSPAEFIPIAESSGMIAPIGRWVLDEAARQIADWDRAGLPPLTLAVNVSSVQLRQLDLPAQVRSALGAAGVGVERLELELTEGAAMRDPEGAIAVMNALYEQGTELAIDDFGTGYSSLAYLKRLPVAKLKIDRSFVADITSEIGSRAIVDAIIRMAASLGMRTVAEGVETPEQLAFLHERGCHAMQGWLLAKPMDAESFAAFVRERAVA